MNEEHLLAHFDRISEAPSAIPRLRRFILDLAVRGKLVEQDPKDEPASELLKRIQTEKARLVKKREIRIPRVLETTDEEIEIFPLPALWAWCRMSEVGAVVGGGTPPSADADNFTNGGSGTAWLTPADLGTHTSLYVSHGARDLTPQGLRSSSATLMPKGSVLFTSRAPIGYTAIAANEVSTNQGFKSIVPFVPACNLYIAVYFRAFGKWIDGKASGTTFREVSGKIVASLPFPLPPLAEQHRIVAKVAELMALCDGLEAAQAERECRRNRLTAASLNRLNNGADRKAFGEHARFHLRHLPHLITRPEHIKQLRQTILNLAVHGRLVLQDPNDESASELLKRIQALKVRLVKEEKISRDRPLPLIAEEDKLGQLPNGWEWVRMQEAFDVRDGTHDTPKYIEDDGVPLITSRNFVDGRISFEHAKFISLDDHNLIKKRSGVDQGDILYSMIGGNIGNQVMVETDREFSIKNVALFKYYSKSETTPRYLDLFLKTVTIGLQGQAAGGAQPFVSLKQLRSIPFPMPPLPEQHRIVAKVDELMVICDQLEAQLTATQTDSSRLLEVILDDALSENCAMLQEALKT